MKNSSKSSSHTGILDRNTKIHLSALDAIRGIAIFSVFLYHILGASFNLSQLNWDGAFRDFQVSRSFLLLYPLTYGWVGVAIFFVASGFCIHLSHIKSGESDWKPFFIRRFFRIYPAYLVALLLFSYFWPSSFSNHNLQELNYQFLSHLLCIHNFDNSWFGGINPSFWSIAVEVQLYLIYPVLLFITKRTGWRFSLIICFSIEVFFRFAMAWSDLVYDTPLPRWFSSFPLAYWFSWSIGAYLADCYLRKNSPFFKTVPFLPILAIAFALPLFRPTKPFAFLFFAFATGIAIERFNSKRWVIPDVPIFSLIWSHLCFLGTISYSFYLFHQPLVNSTNSIISLFFPIQNLHPLILFTINLFWYFPIIVLSHLSYTLIEQKFISAGKRFLLKQGL